MTWRHGNLKTSRLVRYSKCAELFSSAHTDLTSAFLQYRLTVSTGCYTRQRLTAFSGIALPQNRQCCREGVGVGLNRLCSISASRHRSLNA